jgi:CO/xanthine dehydrogenase FAD-binding subunit
MDFWRPRSLPEALEMKRQRPDGVPIVGGTDLMVDINFGRRRPPALLDLSRVDALREWSVDRGTVTVGSAVTYTRIQDELAGPAPGMAMASRTVGSPQIRNRGTIGGNLGSASPAGDALPPLLAGRASVRVASAEGSRRISIDDFFAGPKRNTLQPDELIVSVDFPLATGPQQFSKIGPRNAMVIAVASFALSLWPEQRRVGTGLGSAAPTPRRAPEAEAFLEGEMASSGFWERRRPLEPRVVERFGQLVAAASQPIDDVRGSGWYRRHGLAVLAERTLGWAGAEYLAA